MVIVTVRGRADAIAQNGESNSSGGVEEKIEDFSLFRSLQVDKQIGALKCTNETKAIDRLVFLGDVDGDALRLADFE